MQHRPVTNKVLPLALVGGCRHRLTKRFDAGLNVALTTRVYLKAEVHFVSFQNPVKDGYERFACSLAMTF